MSCCVCVKLGLIHSAAIFFRAIKMLVTSCSFDLRPSGLDYGPTLSAPLTPSPPAPPPHPHPPWQRSNAWYKVLCPKEKRGGSRSCSALCVNIYNFLVKLTIISLKTWRSTMTTSAQKLLELLRFTDLPAVINTVTFNGPFRMTVGAPANHSSPTQSPILNSRSHSQLY